MGEERLSRHPADRLIHELIGTRRAAADDEIEQIVERMATAPFGRSTVRVPVKERGARYGDLVLGTRADSLTYHMVKRVAIEQQWPNGTSGDQYLADLARAIRDPGARLTVCPRRGGSIAAIITPTARVMPAHRLGAEPAPQLLVIYSADRGMIVTGYQFSTLDQTGVPEEAVWLR